MGRIFPTVFFSGGGGGEGVFSGGLIFCGGGGLGAREILLSEFSPLVENYYLVMNCVFFFFKFWTCRGNAGD